METETQNDKEANQVGAQRPPLSALLSSALDGTLDMRVAAEAARRIGKECEAEEKDSFTMGDLRRVRRDIYEGR